MMRILIHRLGPGLGDIVRCLPALEAARNRWPSADITLMAPAEYLPLFEGNPHINRAIAPPRRFGRRMRRVVGGVAHAPPRVGQETHPRAGVPQRYDLVIDLFAPAAEMERAAPWLSRQEIFCRLVGAEPTDWIGQYRVTPAERAWAAAYLDSQARSPGDQESRAGRQEPGGTVAIQRHAASPLRNWPWVEDLAERLRSAGRRTLILERRAGTTVRQLAALIAACDLLVAPDSGPLHLAALVRTPCLGLFGPTDPAVILKHYPRHEWLSAIGRGEACLYPCRERARPTCRRARTGAVCLASITPEQTTRAADEVLRRGHAA